MPIDTQTPQSPGWWLLRLNRKLEARQKRLNDLDARFRGDPPLPEGAETMRDAYRAFQRKARTNFAQLIVDSRLNRMLPVGFRTGAGGDDTGDDVAWKVWSTNGLPVEASTVHESMLAMGDGYVIVGFDDDLGEPVITAEDPRQVVTIHDPVRQRVIRAGLKVFHDPEEERDFAYLYLPGQLFVASREIRRHVGNSAVRFNQAAWGWDAERSGEIPGTVVPIVRFRNRRGVGEFEPHIDLLDRINHQILQRMVIATMQAFRQRAAKGLPEFDKAGNKIDWNAVLAMDPGALWALPAAVEMWESGQVDLTPVLTAVEHDVRHLAAVTPTPMHILNPESANQSAEGAALAREGLLFTVRDRKARASEGWKDVMSLAFLFAGDERRADRSKLEVLWDDSEHRSLSEMSDASSKSQDLPLRTRLTRIWGFSPDEVARVETEIAAEKAANPPPPPPPAADQQPPVAASQ